MKNKPLTKKQRKDLVDAYVSLNIVNVHFFRQKNGQVSPIDTSFDPHTETRRIYKLLEGIIIDIDDSDL